MSTLPMTQRSSERTQSELPLTIDIAPSSVSVQPVSFGVPLPKGSMTLPVNLSLIDSVGNTLDVQSEILETWSDGSVAWLLVDVLLDPRTCRGNAWKLRWSAAPSAASQISMVQEHEDHFAIATGACDFLVDRQQFGAIRAVMNGQELLQPDAGALRLTDSGETLPLVLKSSVETAGPLRTTLRFDGEFPGRPMLRFVGRLSFFATTALIKVTIKLHNADRARHVGGIWDLGDEKSVHFRDLSFDLALADEGPWRTTWQKEPDAGVEASEAGVFEIYQHSSGGENWSSANHVNQDGIVPLTFCGYSVRWGETPQLARGKRAQPVVRVGGARGGVTVAIPEFWQQFPKAISVHENALKIGIFAGLADGLHSIEETGSEALDAADRAPMGYGFELQGGEQKSHTFWLALDNGSPQQPALDWVHTPPLVTPHRDWWLATDAVPFLPSLEAGRTTPLDDYLRDVLVGPDNLFRKRETIDEYGWRNFGDIFADHEATYYTGELPLVSHYNNQYDQVLGLLMQYLRTADRRWWDLGDPLARHVMDIDIYHTLEDKAGYSGGMHWFTDHYLHAHTSSHRTYSRINAPTKGPYGGGPSSMHVFSSGLLLYHRLTGDPEARAAVLELAHWLMRAEDSRFHPLGFLDDGPTGATTGDRGPHRASGNTISVVLDAWQLTKDPKYLQHAEAIIRRTIHPADDVAARDLLDVENRWSYTVYLSSLHRYLSTKAELGELDHMYAYARAALRAYGRWMLEHEQPYFDQEQNLEYPTESWGGQEFRKANVLRYAARLEQDPLRTEMLGKADRLSERGWHDLLRFPTRYVARAIALVLVEGTRDTFLRIHAAPPLPEPRMTYDFGSPKKFQSIKKRIQVNVRSPAGLLRMGRTLLDPRRWLLLFHRPDDVRTVRDF